MVLGWLAVAVPACTGSDDAGGGGDGEADASTPPGADAGPGGAPDAGGVATGLCTAETVHPGATVIFHDADGQPLAAVQTGDDGVATFDRCVDGGMVTLVLPANEVVPTRKLVTVQGVYIGDVVRFVQGLPEEPTAGALTLTVQHAFDDVTSGATQYVGTLGDCTEQPQALQGSSGGTLQAASLTACLGEDPTTLVAVSIARDAMGQPVGFARSSTTDLSTPSLATGGDWVAWGGLTKVPVINVPAGATSGFRTVIPYIDGVGYGLQYGSAPVGGGELSLAYWPAEIVDEHRIALSYVFAAEETSSLALMRTATPPAELDAGEILLARPTSIVADVSDPARPRIQWQGGDDRTDFTRGELGFTDAAGTGVWIIVHPGNPRELRVPVLDAPNAAVGPGEGAQIGTRQLWLVDREATFEDHLAEGVSVNGANETFHVVDVREVAGKTLRFAGYEIDE
jgi:hypothetical protein